MYTIAFATLKAINNVGEPSKYDLIINETTVIEPTDNTDIQECTYKCVTFKELCSMKHDEVVGK